MQTRKRHLQNQRRRKKSPEGNTRYFMPIIGEKKKVCKSMFLNTLGINKGVVDIAMQKRS